MFTLHDQPAGPDVPLGRGWVVSFQAEKLRRRDLITLTRDRVSGNPGSMYGKFAVRLTEAGEAEIEREKEGL